MMAQFTDIRDKDRHDTRVIFEFSFQGEIKIWLIALSNKKVKSLAQC